MFMQIAFSWLFFPFRSVKRCAGLCSLLQSWAVLSTTAAAGSWGSFSSFEYCNLLHCINWWWQTALLWKKLHAASMRGSAAMPQSYIAPSQGVPSWQKPCSLWCTSVLQMFAHTSPCSSEQQSTTSFGNEGRRCACWAKPWSSFHWSQMELKADEPSLATVHIRDVAAYVGLEHVNMLTTCMSQLYAFNKHLIWIINVSSPKKVLWCYKTHKLFKYKLQVCKNSIKKVAIA